MVFSNLKVKLCLFQVNKYVSFVTSRPSLEECDRGFFRRKGNLEIQEGIYALGSINI